MVDRSETKSFVRMHKPKLRTRLSSFYAATLESKIARTFTDDVDIYHGAPSRRGMQYRPGQRDDESLCKYGTMLPV
jgi:hypothetical protein